MGSSMIYGTPGPAPATDPPLITDPEDPEFFPQMEDQIDQMDALLAQIRNLRR
jgi:hypothetical protein